MTAEKIRQTMIDVMRTWDIDPGGEPLVIELLMSGSSEHGARPCVRFRNRKLRDGTKVETFLPARDG